ncbi:hypothetical protein [Streptomyces sp. WMMC905]|uniref:hypothetical protein n=1 Tax=Streptomyces sp. WMMC905 TaxID=3404123 RepID=UPI003B9392AB
MTKINSGVGGAAVLAALISPPPVWTFGVVGAVAAVVNLAPGPRSVGRWAVVGYRRVRERAAPASLTGAPGETVTWTLYPDHGAMQDPRARAGFHEAFARALVLVAGQARTAGIQVHVTHDAVVGDGTEHTQTVSVHVPRGVVGRPARVLGTLEAEFARLGRLAVAEPAPVGVVCERGPGWVGLDDGRYASTARVTAWPDTTDGALMSRLLLGQGQGAGHHASDRSFSVLYRPLPSTQSRRSARLRSAAAEAFTTDQVKQDAHRVAGDTAHDALVQGGVLVDVDAYLTVWGDSPESVTDARWQASLAADVHRVRLDWLTGQQHRAHVMTTPHGASTRKGAVL